MADIEILRVYGELDSLLPSFRNKVSEQEFLNTLYVKLDKAVSLIKDPVDRVKSFYTLDLAFVRLSDELLPDDYHSKIRCEE